MLNLPLGYDNFGQIRQLGLTLVDKTLFIKDFIDDQKTQVALITRPRRFGKSLNLSMLHHFFATKVGGIITKGLFDDLKIAKEGDAYMRHQGQYPVIAVSFKDVKERKFKTAYSSLCGELARAFYENRHILDHPAMTTAQKKDFRAVLNRKASEDLIRDSLHNLSTYLFQCYGQNAILLIDEYDSPIQSGYIHGYYDKMIEVMRHLFSSALKTNLYLHRAVLTGILRVSKESLFSGLNNIKVYSMFNNQYSEYFGFTEAEVDSIFVQSGLSVALDDVRTWYNGYQIGQQTIYNPWSIVNCIADHGTLKPYWVGTSGNEILKSVMAQTSAAFKTSIESLLQKIPVDRLIDENFVFADLTKDESAIWSLLLASGYLKAVAAAPEDTKMNCKLLIPNFEVMCLYKDIFKEWFSDKMGQEDYQLFLHHLLAGRITDFIKMLKSFLLESASHFDVKGKHPEKFYHGFVLGLMASLQKTHIIKSNRESGYGCYDVMIIPKDLSQRGIILEFKSAEEDEDLTTAAQTALQQVNDRHYAAELTQAGITSILKLGLAFKGKDVVVVYETLNV